MATGAPVSPTTAGTSLFAATRRVAQLEEQFATYATQNNAEQQSLAARVLVLEGTLRQREEEIKAALDTTAAQRAAELASVVAAARSEFETQRAQLQRVVETVEGEFKRFQEQLDSEIGGGGGKETKGFLPL